MCLNSRGIDFISLLCMVFEHDFSAESLLERTKNKQKTPCILTLFIKLFPNHFRHDNMHWKAYRILLMPIVLLVLVPIIQQSYRFISLPPYALVKRNLQPTHLKSPPLFTFTTKSLGQDSSSSHLFSKTIGSRFTAAKNKLGWRFTKLIFFLDQDLP